MRFIRKVIFGSIMMGCFFVAGVQAATPSAKGTEVYFISPTDGATVSSPVHIQFGLKGMGVAPAGVDKENTGHHHLIIDADEPAMGKPIGKDDPYGEFVAIKRN